MGNFDRALLLLVFATLLSSFALADACYNSVQSIPANCTGGTFTTDSWNGCRTLVCAGSGSNMTVMACDKSGFFEMYKQATAGTAVSKICIGSTCISDTGYAKSANFPICISNSTCTPTNGGTEICDGIDNNCNGQIDENNVCAPTCTPTTEICNGVDDNCNGQIDENNVCASLVCYSRVQDMPVNCTGGTVTQDSFNGCRTVVCTGGANSIQVLACDKPSTSNAEYFEMYRQSTTGTPPKVCIGTLCMQSEGYKQSGHYPLCMNANTTNTTTCTPTNNGVEICDGKDNNCNGQVDENNVCAPPPSNTTCYNSVQNIPATCTGASISSDTWNGCRTILCGTTKIQACDKTGYFEMYRQAGDGSSKICIASTCIQNEGYAKSGNFPICIGNSTNTTNNTCTPTNNGVEICDGKDNNCNGQIDENNVCTPPPGPVCYNKMSDIPASCTGGNITQDTLSGSCRTLVCSIGSASMKVLACDKTSYFEMYKQEQVGTQLQICLASTCISNSGYVQSTPYPICMNQTTTTSGFVWIEPVENQNNTPPNFFHLNVEVPSNEAQISNAEWEVWNSAMTERVWFANNTGSIRFHTHTPDGTFQGSLAGQTQLAYNTQYKVRTRWKFTNGTYTGWSSTRTFTTSAQQFGTNTRWTLAPGFQIERIATGFDVPVHVIVAPRGMYDSLPDNIEPAYYVTELYGKVKVVHKDGSIGVYAQNLLNFDPFGSITGGGQMGVVGLYVDNVTGDLFVGMVYTDANNTVFNKVERFTSTDDGNGYTGRTVIISGLPSAPSHQVEDITKGPDGKLYIGLGDALNEQNAQSSTALAGRIIRMNMDGTNVETYAYGLRNPFGQDWRPGTNQLFSTDNSPNTNDRLLKINQGENYLWGLGGNDYVGKAIDLLNVSPVDVEFNPGNTSFPSELTGKMYVVVAGPVYAKGPTSGKEIWEYTLDGAGNIIGKRQFARYTGTGYGTPIGIDFGADGLYLTDIYGEAGFVGLGKTEGNIYRITQGNGGCINCGNGTFRAGIQVVSWYPKLHTDTNQVEYLFECNGIDGSGTYKYDFDFGNGNSMQYSDSNRQGQFYPYTDVNYTVTCAARDQGTGAIKSASMVINPSHYLSDGVE